MAAATAARASVNGKRGTLSGRGPGIGVTRRPADRQDFHTVRSSAAAQPRPGVSRGALKLRAMPQAAGACRCLVEGGPPGKILGD